METNPHAYVESLRRSHDRLAGIVDDLGPGGVEAQSYCTDWTIAQVMSHIGSGSEMFGLMVEAALSGGDAPGRETMEPIWASWNERSPQRQAEDGLSAEARFVARAEALTDAEFARMHLSAWGMELDAATILRMRLAENVVHTWDIEVTRDPSARLPADAVDLLVDHLLLMATVAGKPQGKTFALRVRSADPEREFYLAVADGVRLEPWADREVDGDLRITAEALIRLVYGRLDSGHPPASLEITAPNVHLDALQEVFPGL